MIQGSEKEIIERFSESIRKEDPDVITGYNIDGYDIPKILEQAQKVGIKTLNWGRDRSEPQSIKKFWRLNGRLIVDAWWAVRTEIRPKQETLNAVSKLLLNEEKMDVSAKNMDEEWLNETRTRCSATAGRTPAGAAGPGEGRAHPEEHGHGGRVPAARRTTC